MSFDFGNGVSRTLDALKRQFAAVVWQQDKPPLDSELNLMAQIDMDRMQGAIRSLMPSGFLMDPTRAHNDFVVDNQWANLFKLGNPRKPIGVHESQEETPVVWANVNGWLVPIAGSGSQEVGNTVKLYPPPESDGRVDFVFLEVWQTLVRSNPGDLNKPSGSEIWQYGNVQFGGTNLTDDLEDAGVGIETTARVQTQYRIRVQGQGVGLGSGVALDVYPDGLDDPNVRGQGAATSPVAGILWENMREKLGDPGLWRAGNGNPNNDLGTIDGYTYAIPICAVFRRNSNVYLAVASAGNPNQNGAFERTPGVKLLADPLEGARVLLEASLTDYLDHDSGMSAAATIAVTNLNGSGLEDDAHVLTSTFLQIENEIVGISNVNVGGGTITIPSGGRGRWGTAAVGHPVGTPIRFFNSRPDGLYSDQVAAQDILDLRRAVNPGDWDYQRLLTHNIGALVKGDLRTAWKQSGAGDTEGVTVHEVDYLHADGTIAAPNHTEVLDGPDGVRCIWSDAAVIQQDITLLLDDDPTVDANGVGLTTNDQFDTNVRWEVGPDFNPVGFLNVGGSPNAGYEKAWTNGTSIHLFLGGETGSEGARRTFRDGGERAVRFVTPKEMWKTGYPNVSLQGGQQYPAFLRFLSARAHEPAPPGLSTSLAETHPGPMYPWQASNFESPYLVLGGLLNPNLQTSIQVDTDLINTGSEVQEVDLGFNFDASGVFYTKNAVGDFEADPSSVTHPFLRGTRTLWEMLTNDGQDATGQSSEVYLILYGDADSTQNNGAFRVVGAGTVGYTTHNASNGTSVVVQPLSADWSTVTRFEATGNSVTAEIRSQHHNSDDTSSYEGRVADLVVVLTDLKGEGNHPWSDATLTGGGYDNSFNGEVEAGKVGVLSKLLLTLSVMYHPGRGGMARIPDEVARVSLRGPTSQSVGTYLQQSSADRDPSFSAFSGVPTDETMFDHAHIQTWNRLPGYGWHAPEAPNFGGNVVGFTESDREAQVFLDKGSKTLLLRPFRDRGMTLQSLSYRELGNGAANTLWGTSTYPLGSQKDGLGLFTNASNPAGGPGRQTGFAIPREFMPRFGRQDIPYYVDLEAGQGSFLSGINHLFTDKTDVTNPVFNIIGGSRDNITGGNEVTVFHFQTGTPTDYGVGDTVGGGFLNLPNMEARKTTDIDPNANQWAQEILSRLASVNSSDFGRGLRGIQMPPYYGLARVLGVYERQDFLAKGGRTFKLNRWQVEADPATNLLREDASKQTLYILRDGAKDLTLTDDDHTYIIPENALDISRIPVGWTPNSDFADFDYVVVATVFGFAKGFINKNNLVLPRRHNGQGALRVDNTSLHLEGVPMCIPCPAGANDKFYVAHNRTVYQGDPFMSRHGENRTTSDYEFRYGQIPVAGQFSLRTPIQQYDAAGNFVPETINEKSFEVLASLDFYTTLGTGKIGGRLYPGTVLDVGYTEDTPGASLRAPLTEDQPAWRVQPRAFTEGQITNTSRALATLEILDNESLANANGEEDAFRIRLGLLDGSVVDLYGAVQGFRSTLTGAPHNIPDENIFVVDQTQGSKDFVYRNNNCDFGILSPLPENSAAEFSFLPNLNTHPEAEIPTGANAPQVSVTVTPVQRYSNAYGDVLFDGRSDPITGEIVLRAVFQPGGQPFYTPDSGDDPLALRNVRVFNYNPGALNGGAVASTTFAWVGADPTKQQVAVVNAALAAGLLADVRVGPAVDQITLTVTNTGAGVIGGVPTDFTVALLEEIDVAAASINLSSADLIIDVRWEMGSKLATADNLVAVINDHPALQQSMKAYNDGSPKVIFEAIPVGAEGNGLSLAVSKVSFDTGSAGLPVLPLERVFRLTTARNNLLPRNANITHVNLSGGRDQPVNAGNGTTQIALTGMTERLPLGALLQDSDFLGENPLGDAASAMRTSPVGLRPVQTLLPLTEVGDEFTRFMGAPGELLALTEGSISVDGYAAYTTGNPTGSRRFRLYRGGGSAYVLHGDMPGGPLEWVSDSLSFSSQPVLKGGLLVCRALLVRNFYEEAFSGSPYKVSDGDEIQLVLLTYGILGNGATVEEGIDLNGILSPSGYGEGYAAADRYRINGRPMFRGFSQQVPNPVEVTLAVYDETSRAGGESLPSGR